MAKKKHSLKLAEQRTIAHGRLMIHMIGNGPELGGSLRKTGIVGMDGGVALTMQVMTPRGAATGAEALGVTHHLPEQMMAEKVNGLRHLREESGERL